MQRDDLGTLIVMNSQQVDDLPWVDSGKGPGVKQKTLWQSGSVMLGLMRIEPGSINPVHTHEHAQHHILVTHGSAHMMGKPVDAGSYVYVPPGTAHGVTDIGPEGITFFYTYRPVEGDKPREALRSQHPAVSDAQAAVAF